MSLLYVFTHRPHGSINAQEGLDALLMGSAFAPCSALFLGDALYQLLEGQAPEAIGAKHFAKTFGALADFGVTRIYCSKEDLEDRNLAPENLVINVDPLDVDAIQQLLADAQTVMNF